MGKWVNKKLVELAKHIQSGGTPKSDNTEYYGGDIPFVSIEDMTASGKYLSKTVKNITDTGLKNSAAWLVPENAVMYSIYATLGLPVISKICAATNQAILNIVVDDETTDVEFLYYYLLSLRGQIHKFSSQTTQSNLNAKIVKNFDLFLPEEKPEQTRIAQILSKADAAIAQTEAMIAKYQRIKTGLMQDLLTRGIDEYGNIRSKATHKFVVKNGIEVPEEWEVKELSEIGNIITGSTPPIKDLNNYGEEYLFVTPADVTTNQFIISTDRRLSEQGFSLCRILPKNSICVVCIGSTIGKISMTNEQCTTNQQINSIVPFQIELAEYYFYSLQVFLDEQLRREAGLQAVPIVNKSSFSKMIIPVPMEKNEAFKILKHLNKIQSAFEKNQNNLRKLQSLKTGLMQDLLSGKVRVKIEEHANISA